MTQDITGDDDDAASRLLPNMRPLRILEILASADQPIGPPEIAAASELPKPTVHRLLRTLEAEGYVQRDLDGRSWLPGARAVRLGWGMSTARQAVAGRQTVLRQLAADIGESCNLAVPDDESMRYIERVETQWPLQIRLPVGTRVPLHCTASGKMYLSSLPTERFEALASQLHLTAETPQTITDLDALRREVEMIRRRGHAEDNEEMIQGMVALAVPIRRPGGGFAGTVSFHAPTLRLKFETARKFLPRLLKAAEALSVGISGDSRKQ